MSDDTNTVVEIETVEKPEVSDASKLEVAKASEATKLEVAKASYVAANAAYTKAKADSDAELSEHILALATKHNLNELTRAMHEAQKELHTLMVSSSGEFATAVFNAKDALKSARAELVAAAKLNSQAMDSLDAARDSFAEAKKAYKDSKTADLKAALTEAKIKLSAEEVLRKAARDRLRAAKSASMSASGALAMLKRRPPAH
jgi:hypothetical protein